jgi:hypothetical protein
LQCFCQVPRGKNFSACEKFLFAHISSATAFGGGLGSKHCTSVPWLCECWCGKIWECFKSPDAPFGTILDEYALQDGWHPSCYREHPQRSTGNIPKRGIRGLKALPSVTAPALAKPWHASAMLPSPQPNAVAEEICEKKKTVHRLKSAFHLGTG